MEADAATQGRNAANPTLGFFMSRFGSYQEIVSSGTVQVAEKYNASVLCFIGGELNSQIGFRKHWNVIYDLARQANLDGLIVLSGTLQTYVTAEEMAQFCARYAPVPTVSISQEPHGVPGLTIDNTAGLHQLIRHLVDDHQYTRIAFIGGPENNPEAMARYHTYSETLKHCGIPLDPDLIAPGDFRLNAGVEAVKMLLDERKVSFDAIVASSDNMAFGAWQELTRRGFNIPSDVAITGFDDVPEARSFATPLTTVRQPLVEQGRQAALMLLDHLHHGTPLVSHVFETELIIRESCGCMPSATSCSLSQIPLVPPSAPHIDLTQQRNMVLTGIQKVICSRYPDISLESIEPLVGSFFNGLQGGSYSEFLPIFSRLLAKATMNLSRNDLAEGIMVRWQEALSILREQALPCKLPDVTADLDGLLHQGRVLIAEAAERAHSHLQSRIEASMLAQSYVIREINAASDMQQIVDILARDLPELGICTCALILYEGKPIPSPSSRLIMAYHNGDRLAIDPAGCLFPSAQLLPPGILSEQRPPFLIVHPLAARDTHFGFILMETVPGHQAIYNAYEELLEQVGLALHRAMLLQQIEQSNRELQQRAAELTEANTQLEQFAYVASHDLQEPLRMVTSYLQLIEMRYKDKLDADAEEFISYAVDGATRMKRMIDDLLTYSRVTTRGQPLEPTNCDDLLAQSLSNLEIAIRESDALVTHDPLPTVMADSTQLMAVFQNLIGNAIKFHADRQPQIHVSAEQRQDEWLFSVHDNGIGIAPEYYERIFAVFSRLHTQTEYPGTGIGLAICKKVVERHGGRIWVESRPGEGSIFYFTISAQI